MIRRNTLLNRLSKEDLCLLDPFLTRVELKQGQVLFERDADIDNIFFFESGLCGEIACNEDGEKIEVGCVGFEGMAGLSVITGTSAAPFTTLMQAAGCALMMPSHQLLKVAEGNAPLKALLLHYVYVTTVQIAATGLANARYVVRQRLARWLLMFQDRIGDKIPLTHEFLSLLLGVRRPSITDALHMMEGERSIAASRSLVIIKDRRKLEVLAASAYGVPENAYRRLIGEPWPRR